MAWTPSARLQMYIYNLQKSPEKNMLLFAGLPSTLRWPDPSLLAWTPSQVLPLSQFVWDRILLCSSDWPQTHNLYFFLFPSFSQPPQCLGNRHTWPHSIYVLTSVYPSIYLIWCVGGCQAVPVEVRDSFRFSSPTVWAPGIELHTRPPGCSLNYLGTLQVPVLSIRQDCQQFLGLGSSLMFLLFWLRLV